MNKTRGLSLTAALLILTAGFLFAGGARPVAVSTNAAVTNAVLTNVPTNYMDQPLDFGQFENNNGRARSQGGFNIVGSIIQLLIYAALFGVAIYFIIRYIAKKSGVPVGGESSLIEVMRSQNIGMGALVEVVRVGKDYYTLAVTGQAVTLVGKIEDKETIDYIELNKEQLKPKTNSFVDILTYLPIGKKADRMDFLKSQKDKLKKL